MTIDILMPALSPTMTEGNLAKWHKKVGDKVRSGDVIAEIETDKATVEVEAADDGVLGKVVVPEGAKGVKVNEIIAVLIEEGEEAGAVERAKAPAPSAPPAAARVSAAAPAPAAPSPAPRAAPSDGDGARMFASPLARRMARQAGLDLKAVRGSGPHGRIVKADIEAALVRAPGVTPAAAPMAAALAPIAQAVAKPALASVPTAGPVAKPSVPLEAPGLPPFTEVPHSTMRRVIARRMAEAKREAPHFYLTVDCTVDKLMAMRRELNERVPKDGPDGYKLSVNDFVIRAIALAMLEVPAANAAWSENAVRRYQGVDVSVAVAIPNGLITPVVRSAERKGLKAISNEMRKLAEKARAGKLMPEDYQGGTVTLSNLGMHGVKEFAAVLNAPQGAILAVGAAEPRPVVKDGALAIATVMTCTLSVDHRSVDGAVGAEFLAAFKRLIEDPVTMLL